MQNFGNRRSVKKCEQNAGSNVLNYVTPETTEMLHLPIYKVYILNIPST